MKIRFYITWLKLACIVTGITGLISVLASSHDGSIIWLKLFDLLKWPLDNDPAGFQNETYAVNAVLGGVMMGWASLMYLLITKQVEKGNYELLKYILISIVFWFISDSVGSIYAHLPANIILNMVFLIMFLVPILILLKHTGNIDNSTRLN